MGFDYSHKRLEKLCREIMNVDEKGITAYINEMENSHRGSFYVRGWKDDLKQLKHYRWVRTQIAHEPDCTEANMTTPEDAQWLEEFRARIMNQTDPLSLYRKATQLRPKAASRKAVPQNHEPESVREEEVPKSDPKPVRRKRTRGIARGFGVFLLCLILLAAAVIIFLACSEMVGNFAVFAG